MKRILKAWKRGGLPIALRVVVNRLVDNFQEHRLRIRSKGLVPIERLITKWQDCHDYFPSTICDFQQILDDLYITSEDVFVDYGSGMGRVLVLAAHYPFRRVIGVEVSEALNIIARTNVYNTRKYGLNDKIEITTGNACSFLLPNDATVLYFYNPFHGNILHSVFQNIHRSLDACPRHLYIIFNNPAHFLPVEGDYPWLVRKREYFFEYHVIVYETNLTV